MSKVDVKKEKKAIPIIIIHILYLYANKKSCQKLHIILTVNGGKKML